MSVFRVLFHQFLHWKGCRSFILAFSKWLTQLRYEPKNKSLCKIRVTNHAKMFISHARRFCLVKGIEGVHFLKSLLLQLVNDIIHFLITLVCRKQIDRWFQVVWVWCKLFSSSSHTRTKQQLSHVFVKTVNLNILLLCTCYQYVCKTWNTGYQYCVRWCAVLPAHYIEKSLCIKCLCFPNRTYGY